MILESAVPNILEREFKSKQSNPIKKLEELLEPFSRRFIKKIGMNKKLEEALITFARPLAESSPLTRKIEKFLVIDAMPVDTRHNVKINREALAVWAAEQLKR